MNTPIDPFTGTPFSRVIIVLGRAALTAAAAQVRETTVKLDSLSAMDDADVVEVVQLIEKNPAEAMEEIMWAATVLHARNEIDRDRMRCLLPERRGTLCRQCAVDANSPIRIGRIRFSPDDNSVVLERLSPQ